MTLRISRWPGIQGGLVPGLHLRGRGTVVVTYKQLDFPGCREKTTAKATPVLSARGVPLEPEEGAGLTLISRG